MFSQRLAALLLAVAVASAADTSRQVILVRHAEKAAGTGDEVGLSEAGQCRAGVLAGMLAQSGVNRIYTSEVARTKQTADPLAKKLAIGPQEVLAGNVKELIEKLRTGKPGVALVVSHSNRVPEIVAGLGAGQVGPIGDTEFDWMFIVTLAGSKKASVVTLRYPGCGQQLPQ